MKLIISILALSLTIVGGAPVQEQDSALKHRASTKEILALESQLKKAAGEDKKYFAEDGARPVPQVDGLEEYEDHEPNVAEELAQAAPHHPLSDHEETGEHELQQLSAASKHDEERPVVDSKPGEEEEEEAEEDGELQGVNSEAYEELMQTLKIHPEWLRTSNGQIKFMDE